MGFPNVSGVKVAFYSFAEVRGRVQALVDDAIRAKGLSAEAAAHASLAESGLASMDMVNLMLGVEAMFDFMIPQADLTPETFRSVETIAAMVVRHLPQAAAA